MTSEEMNRAFEFIIQHQAQLATEMEDLARLHKRDHELLAQLTLQGQRISELIVIESGRLDRAEKQLEIQQQRLERAEQEDRAAAQRRDEEEEKRHEEEEKRHEEAQKRHEQLMQELRDRLDRIFEKLS